MRKKVYKHKFTSLEKILLLILGIIVFKFIISFVNLPLLNFIPEPKTEVALKRQYLHYVDLVNKKDYDSMYKKFSYESKKEQSLSEFIKEADKVNKKNGFKSQEVQVNKISFDGNIGYIDRTSVICYSDDCKKKETLRGYKKWIYENYHWRLVNISVPPCIRKTPYEKPVEFDRAMSLIKQRFSDKFGGGEKNYPFLNCVDIQYNNLDKEEGYFIFDPNDSSLDKLTIFVDHSYKIKDDVLTAFLLTHELNHVGIYLTKLINGVDLPCIEDEIQAFQSQLLFLGTLNEEEQNSLVGRIVTTDYRFNNPLLLIKTFTDFVGNARNFCGYNQTCFNEKVFEQLTNLVKNDPYYQKQCNLN